MVDISAFDKDRRMVKEAVVSASYPLTYVPYFVAKHRSLKKANADAAANGLPPPKSVALYIDMAIVRNFDHYNDIGKNPNDPVARDKVRREALETAEVKRQEEVSRKARKELLSDEAFTEWMRNAAGARFKEEQKRAIVWVETTKNIREGGWYSRGSVNSPFVNNSSKKRKHVAGEGDNGANKKRAVSHASDSSKENVQLDEEAASVEAVPE
jgi:hypothetical protein